MKKIITLLLLGAMFFGSVPIQAHNNVGYEKYYEKFAPATVLVKMKVRVTEKDRPKSAIEGILVRARSRVGWGGCSGTLISKDGKILTAAHCVDVNKDTPYQKLELLQVWVKTIDGKGYLAKVVRVDVKRDLALLDIAGENHPFLTLGVEPKPGQEIIVIASPLDLQWTISQGIVSRLNHLFKDEKTKFIQHTAMINPGSSGSALLDENGRIVGVNTRILGFFLWNGLSFAVDLSEVKTFLKG